MVLRRLSTIGPFRTEWTCGGETTALKSGFSTCDQEISIYNIYSTTLSHIDGASYSKCVSQ